MGQGIIDVMNRISEIERELSEVKRTLAAMSADPGRVEEAVRGYLALRGEVSRSWDEGSSVLGDFRKSRGHGL
jgi:hypothetical protein